MTPHDPTQITPDARAAVLQDFVAGRMRSPLAWGTNDCCMFPADWALALTGRDLAADVRGTYATAEGALRALDSLGGLDAVGGRAGPEVPPRMAAAGDIGIVSGNGGRESLAVCSGEVWLVPTAGGLSALPFTAARRAWRFADG